MKPAFVESRTCERSPSEEERDNSKHSTMPSLRSENTIKLQPAPIPLVNPWNRKQKVPSGDNQAFPPLPPSANNANPLLKNGNNPVSDKDKTTRSSRASSTSSISTTAKSPAPPPSSWPDVLAPTPPWSSKQTLRAAAPRATENLWMHPCGTDVVVQTRTLSFQVHRNIVQDESGWLREKIPPPNLDGSSVEVYLDLAAEPVGHCLRFLYTHRMEVCEPQETQPWNIRHIPCCILGYCAAVALHIPKLATYMLRIVEDTAIELDHQVTYEYAYQNPTDTEMYGFCCHFYNAMELLNHQGPKRLMMPMRLVMAKVADSTFFWLMRHPGFLHTMNAGWSSILPSISLDQVEYRRISNLNGGTRKTIIPSEAALEKLFTESSENYNKDVSTAAGGREATPPCEPE